MYLNIKQCIDNAQKGHNENVTIATLRWIYGIASENHSFLMQPFICLYHVQLISRSLAVVRGLDLKKKNKKFNKNRKIFKKTNKSWGTQIDVLS